MAITTLSNVKSILGITSTADDAQITALIPQVEEDYINIRNKPFDVATKVTYSDASTAGGEIEFSIGSKSELVEFNAGDTVAIIARKTRNQIKPTPYYSIDPTSDAVYFTEKHEQVTDSISVLDLEAESTSVTATVTKMQTVYPKGAEFTAAKMIQFHMTAGTAAGGLGKTSETLGDYSVTFASGQGANIGDYPKDVVGGIKRYVSFT